MWCSSYYALLWCIDIAEPIAFSNSYFGAGDGPIIYSQMACGGWERDIDDCDKAEVLEFTCSRDKVAGVLCGYGEKIFAINAHERYMLAIMAHEKVYTLFITYYYHA